MEYPKDLLYTASHEWVRNENGLATVGITDYAQQQLKDIVYVDFPEVGATCKNEESIAALESAKTAVEIYAPLTGRIAEINTFLKENPQLINEDPYGKGWILRIEVQKPEELGELLSCGEYLNSLPEE